MCGECTSEVMPVTRTLGQMAMAVQAPAVEPMMMVIETSPFPEPVADTPGAHPPEVAPPEPMPLEALFFEEHLIFHESLDMPANVGPRLADARYHEGDHRALELAAQRGGQRHQPRHQGMSLDDLLTKLS